MSNDNYLEATVNSSNSVSKPVEAFKPKLTRKQEAFVKEMVDNPRQSATDAAAKAYDVHTRGGSVDPRNTASSIAAENLRKPAIIMALGEHSKLFESAIVGTVREWQDSDSPRKREIALDAAKFGHDKVFGKSTVKIEQQSTVVQIAINLTGDGEQPPEDIIDLSKAD